MRHAAIRPRHARVAQAASPPAASDDTALAVFTGERERLFAIAYRMLGTVEDAEDIVQEAFLRWHKASTDTIESPAAWLTTVVTRLAIHQLQSAHATRETYIGPWLPEPLVTPDADSPSMQAELSDSLSIAFLTVLERLSPRERAVFLLRDVFAYEYAEISRIVELSEANCRQIFRRARQRLDERRRRFPADRRTHQRLLESFARAINDGDVDGVIAVLAHDAVLWADGGGHIRGAALRPIRGAESVARFVIGVRQKIGSADVVGSCVVNGRLALLASADGELQRIVWVDTRDDRIAGVYVAANPDKLRAAKRSLG